MLLSQGRQNRQCVGKKVKLEIQPFVGYDYSLENCVTQVVNALCGHFGSKVGLLRTCKRILDLLCPLFFYKEIFCQYYPLIFNAFVCL